VLHCRFPCLSNSIHKILSENKMVSEKKREKNLPDFIRFKCTCVSSVARCMRHIIPQIVVQLYHCFMQPGYTLIWIFKIKLILEQYRYVHAKRSKLNLKKNREKNLPGFIRLKMDLLFLSRSMPCGILFHRSSFNYLTVLCSLGTL